MLGVAALVRWLKRRRDESAPAPGPPAQDPADELRRKLAESRADSEPETAVESPSETVEERRADVHARGRSALSEMTPPDEA